MKNKLMLLILFLMVLSSVTFVSAEISLWGSVVKNENTQIVKHHAFYVFDDTSATNIGKQKDIPLTIQYVTNDLPYNLSAVGYYGEVDWCNLTITHYHNIYGTNFFAGEGFRGGELLNTTVITQSYYFNSGVNTGEVVIDNMRDKDSLIVDMSCHYTDVRSLYVENVLFGSFTTYIPSFECDKCEQYTLEELSNQITRNEETTANELSIYNKIQTLIDWNFQFWLVGSWIIKIAFIFIGVGLIFAGVYYFYSFLTNLAREIS